METAVQPWRPRHNQWVIALTVTMATFMEVLDTSIANVALPHIAGSLSASQEESTWVLTSYLVANAVILPLSAWLADRIGRKRFYMICVFLFTCSSLLCGLAPSLPLLILFRVLQGIGGGGLATSEQSILTDTFAPAQRGMAFAIYGMAIVFAPTIGPTLGGWITDNYSWHWIFFINVPIGIISLLLTQQVVEDPPYIIQRKEESRKVPIDFIGAGLIALGLGCLEVALDKGQEDDWFGSPFIVFFVSASVLAISYFVVWEWREEHPVLNLRLLKNRNLAVSCVLMTLLGAVLYGCTTLIPQYLQNLMGYTAEQAGMALSLGGIVVIVLMPVVGILISRVDARALIAFGFLLTCVALVHMTSIYPGIDFKTAALFRVFQMTGLAFLFVPISTISYVGVPKEEGNQVSGLTNLLRNVGGTLGIATLTTMLARREQVHQNILVAHVTPGNAAFSSMLSSMTTRFAHAGGGEVVGASQAYRQIYQTVQAQAAALSYVDVIWIFAIAAAFAIPLPFLAKRNQAGAPAAAH
jgi:DHA2 family multidrug resistance protein